MTIDEKTYQQYTERIQRGDFLPDTAQAPLPTPEEDIEARVAEYRKQCEEAIKARDRTIERLNAQLNTDHITADMLAAQRAQTDLAVGQAEGIEAKMQQQEKDFEEEKKKLEAQIAELQDKLEDQKHETDYYKQRADELKEENLRLVDELAEAQLKLKDYEGTEYTDFDEQAYEAAREAAEAASEQELYDQASAQQLFEAQLDVVRRFRVHVLERARKYGEESKPYYFAPMNCCADFARTFTESEKKTAVRDIFDSIEDEYREAAKAHDKEEKTARIAATQPKVEAQTVVFGAPHSTTHVDNANQNDKLLTDGRD